MQRRENCRQSFKLLPEKKRKRETCKGRIEKDFRRRSDLDFNEETLMRESGSA